MNRHKTNEAKPKTAREGLVLFLERERSPIQRAFAIRIVDLVAKAAGDELPNGGWEHLFDELVGDGVVTEQDGMVSLDRQEQDRQETVAAGLLF